MSTSALPTRAFWIRASQCWREALGERIATMEQLRDRFTRCIGCGCLSFSECGLVNAEDQLAERGSGAHLLGGTVTERCAARPDPCGPGRAGIQLIR